MHVDIDVTEPRPGVTSVTVKAPKGATADDIATVLEDAIRTVRNQEPVTGGCSACRLM